MKKISALFILLMCASVQAQLTTLVINNYSNYYLYGRLGANGLSGNCFPGVNAPVDGDHIVQPNTLGINYKYSTSNTAATPINNWWVKTSATSVGMIRPYSHASLMSSGAISNNTDWSYYWFQIKDSSLQPFGDFTMGSPTACGGAGNLTYQSGSYAEAEWFTIGGYTYVQIY